MRLPDPKLQICILLLLSLAGLSAVLVAGTAYLAFGRVADSSHDTATAFGAYIAEQNDHASLLNGLQSVVVGVLSATDDAALADLESQLATLRGTARFESFASAYAVTLDEFVALRRESFATRALTREQWTELKSDLYDVNRALPEVVDDFEFQSLVASEGIGAADDTAPFHDSIEIASAAWRIRSALHRLESIVQNALLSESPAFLEMADAESATLRRLLERDFARLTERIAPEYRSMIDASEASLRDTALKLEKYLASERAACAAEAHIGRQAHELTAELLAWYERVGQAEAEGAAEASARLLATHASALQSRALLVLVMRALVAEVQEANISQLPTI